MAPVQNWVPPPHSQKESQQGYNSQARTQRAWMTPATLAGGDGGGGCQGRDGGQPREAGEGAGQPRQGQGQDGEVVRLLRVRRNHRASVSLPSLSGVSGSEPLAPRAPGDERVRLRCGRHLLFIVLDTLRLPT